MTMEAEAAVAAEDQSFEEAFAEFASADSGSGEAAEAVGNNAPDKGEIPAAELADPETGEALKQQAGESDQDFAARLTAAEEAARQWEHKFKSEIGRQTALQRKVQELETQLRSQPQTQQAQRQYSQRMAQLMEDYPEIAGALQEELDSVVGSVREEVRQIAEPLKQQEQQRRYQAEEAQVRERYPDFVEVVNTPEFLDWFQSQPSAVQALAASQEANDAIAVMDYFTASRRQQAANPEVQNIQAKRQQALQRNVSVRNTAPAPVADAPDDFESAFKYFARKRAS